jgi:N-sulfoglucosamine sulfohydrolase
VALSLLRSIRRPFYLEVGFEEPHRPYDFGGATPDMSLGVNVPGYLMDTPETRADMAAFQGAIRQMDRGVGRILAVLDEVGLADSTLVVFATDHGAAMPRAKCTLYDPGIEVATIMRLPSIPARVVSDMVSNVDVTPTLLEALDLPLPGNLEGRSLMPLLRGEAHSPSREVFAEKTFHTAYEPMRAIRTKRHKLIVNFEVGLRFDVSGDILPSPSFPPMIPAMLGTRPHLELYDLEEDRWEQHNLADSPSHAELLRDLRARLRHWMEATNDPLLSGPVKSPHWREAVEVLRR